MIVKYYQYQRLEPSVELFIRRMDELKYRNYASRLLNGLLHSPDFDMEDSVKKTIAIFRLMGIPVREHISEIFRSDYNGISKDWELSEIACSLIILTSDPSKNQIKNIQIRLLEYLGL